MAVVFMALDVASRMYAIMFSIQLPPRCRAAGCSCWSAALGFQVSTQFSTTAAQHHTAHLLAQFGTICITCKQDQQEQ
jgi:hypothetical protein